MWFIYILLCADTSFYIGITNNLEKRFVMHIQGRGAKYTKSHIPKKIVYSESVSTRSEALKREAVLKKLTKSQKQLLIQSKVI